MTTAVVGDRRNQHRTRSKTEVFGHFDPFILLRAIAGARQAERIMLDLALLWVVGVVLAIPVVWWFGRDLTRIPTHTWAVTGLRREHWQWGVLLGWAAGGFPAMVIVLVWFKSVERSKLYHELAEMRRDHHR